MEKLQTRPDMDIYYNVTGMNGHNHSNGYDDSNDEEELFVLPDVDISAVPDEATWLGRDNNENDHWHCRDSIYVVDGSEIIEEFTFPSEDEKTGHRVSSKVDWQQYVTENIGWIVFSGDIGIVELLRRELGETAE